MEKNGICRSGHPKILLVGDDAAVRRSLQMFLLASGYDVRSYASGMALLADISARDAICLIVDDGMPELDGIALLHELRNLGWRGPAILLTARSSTALIGRAVAEGFELVVEKPLRTQSFIDAVGRMAAGAAR